MSDDEEKARSLLHEHGIQATGSRVEGVAEALREAREDGVNALAEHYGFRIDPGEVLGAEEGGA